MYAPLTVSLFGLLIIINLCESATENTQTLQKDNHEIQLTDSVYVKIPKQEDTRSILSLEIDTNGNGTDEGRGKKKKMMEKFMPMFLMPFIIQSTLVPMFLGMIKIMLHKSFMVGTLALVLIILNSFRNHNSYKG